MNVVASVLSLLLAQDAYRHFPESTKEDLAQLKEVILRDLKDPASATHANGLPDFWRMRRNLELACGWTDPDFIPPLLAILEGTSEFRVHAAACLVRYENPDLDRRVAAQGKVKQEMLSGCISHVLSIERLVDDYKRTRKLDSVLRPGDLLENLITLQNGAPPARLEAWKNLAAKEWFAPWREYGLNATEVWRSCKRGDAAMALSRPIVGADRAKDLLALVRRTATLKPEEIDDITANRWELGCDEERKACRDILQSIVTKFAEAQETPYSAYKPLSALCYRPDPANLDLFRRMIGRPSYDLRSLGWRAIVRLDRDETFQILDGCWKEPVEQILTDSEYLFTAIQDLGRKNTPNRERWIDWLLSVQPKVPIDFRGLPSWIDAMASLAGRDFGFNGRYIPHGFSVDAAKKATAAILDWNANGRRR
jgi:hypothetical protein